MRWVRKLDYHELLAVMENYLDIVSDVKRIGIGTAQKYRIMIKDGSYIDFWLSEEGRYSYHWERQHLDGKIYRYNNAPHHKGVKTYPHHFHNGSEENVIESDLSTNPEDALIQVLDFVRRKLSS